VGGRSRRKPLQRTRSVPDAVTTVCRYGPRSGSGRIVWRRGYLRERVIEGSEDHE